MSNLFSATFRNRLRAVKRNRNRIEFDAFVFVLAVFIAIAVMQSFELGGLLAESKSIGRDIGSISANQEVLFERYLSK